MYKDRRNGGNRHCRYFRSFNPVQSDLFLRQFPVCPDGSGLTRIQRKPVVGKPGIPCLELHAHTESICGQGYLIAVAADPDIRPFKRKILRQNSEGFPFAHCRAVLIFQQDLADGAVCPGRRPDRSDPDRAQR